LILNSTHIKYWKCILISEENSSLEEHKILILAQHKFYRLFHNNNLAPQKIIPFRIFILLSVVDYDFQSFSSTKQHYPLQRDQTLLGRNKPSGTSAYLLNKEMVTLKSQQILES
jgi:hypothetical protein